MRDPRNLSSALPTCTQCGGAVTAADGVCARCGLHVRQVGRPSSGPSVSDPASGGSAGARGFGPEPARSIAALMPQWGQVTKEGWCLLGGAVLVFIGSLLPWAQQSVDGYTAVSSHPGGGGVIVFLVLAIAVVAAGWPLLTGGLSKRRLAGASVAAGLLALFAVTNWSDLNSIQKQAAAAGGGFETISVSAGSGIALYTVGVVVLCALIARLWLSLRRAARTRGLTGVTER